MAIVDDATISNEDLLLRILLEDWITSTEAETRPNSLAFLDSNFENSCFISNEQSFTELQRLFPGRPAAGVPVEVLRAKGFVVAASTSRMP